MINIGTQFQVLGITNSYRRGTNKMTGVIFCFVNSSETIPTHTLGELGNTVQFKYVL